MKVGFIFQQYGTCSGQSLGFEQWDRMELRWHQVYISQMANQASHKGAFHALHFGIFSMPSDRDLEGKNHIMSSPCFEEDELDYIEGM